MKQLDDKKIKYVPFYEPDVDEVTAITIAPSIQADKAVSSIPLANKHKGGNKDKHFNK